MPSIKRELSIVKDKTLYKIIYSGGGQVPDYLEGKYTTYVEAKTRLHMWRLKRKADTEADKLKSVRSSRKAKADIKEDAAA